MAKRPQYSRWRRLPPVFRSGDKNWPDPNQDEQRISLYVTSELLDMAEAQANRSGAGTIQKYCTDLLRHAIEVEHAREQVAELEAKRGTLEGLHAISNDPEYLAELSARSSPVSRPEIEAADDATEDRASEYVPSELMSIEVPVATHQVSDAVDAATHVVMTQAAQRGDDPLGFLACLRRGESVSMASVSALAQALQSLEENLESARTIDRTLAYALHRLAFESQVLHTDAWPGAYDEWTVETLRAVQEYVDRILSGQDIRYYPDAARPEDSL